MPTIEEIHQVTAIVGDVAVLATAVGALASAIGSVCGTLGLLRAEVVLDKIGTGSVSVGLDIKKLLSSLGSLVGGKK